MRHFMLEGASALRGGRMIRVEKILHEILSIGLDEEPPEALLLKARDLIEKFKVESTAFHQLAAPSDATLHVARDLEKLRDLVDREIDRRLDEDLADTVCDLLEHLSNTLHAETGTTPERAIKDANADVPAASEAARTRAMIARAAYLRAEQRHFQPGHDVEDWLAAENALEPRPRRSSADQQPPATRK
jgi:hypothetical protein